MLVVVVVVDAMANGKMKQQLGSVTTVLKRSEGAKNQNNVFHRIDLSDTSIERGRNVMVEVFKMEGKSCEKIGAFDARTYTSEDGLTLRKDVITDNNLQPGETIRVDVYDDSVVQSSLDTEGDDEPANNEGVVHRLKVIEGQIKSLREQFEPDD